MNVNYESIIYFMVSYLVGLCECGRGRGTLNGALCVFVLLKTREFFTSKVSLSR